MFTPKLRALSISVPDMGAFAPFIGQSKVNSIDGKQQHHVGKMADAVQELLPERGYAWHHIYQSFCFELPGVIYLEILNHPTVKASCALEGTVAVGIFSASLGEWKDFIIWTKNKTPELRVVGEALLSYFLKFEPFKDMTLKGLVPI